MLVDTHSNKDDERIELEDADARLGDLAAKLKEQYASIVAEPVPEEIVALLEQLEAREDSDDEPSLQTAS